MWVIVSMWKSPKMVVFVALTVLLYLGSLFPLQGFTFFGGYADFGRIGVGIPVAFSFLFGPAAAWGAAIANLLRDIILGHLDASSAFGFVGNFMLGYIPYKMWRVFTAQKPDLRSIKKLALFIGITMLACALCGLTIGWGLYWLGYAPFMMTAVIIALTNMLWAIITGAILLAATYTFVSNHKLLYTNILGGLVMPSKNQFRSFAIVIAGIGTVACFVLGLLSDLGPLAILPLVLVPLAATLLASK